MKYALRLFVTGKGGRSQQALDNLHAICDERMRGDYVLEVIDILDNPQLAEDQKILATPTLIRDLPPPPRRLIGDLSQLAKVLDALGLSTRDDRDDAAVTAEGADAAQAKDSHES
jgi:circadian clock protein KaiB